MYNIYLITTTMTYIFLQWILEFITFLGLACGSLACDWFGGIDLGFSLVQADNSGDLYITDV